MDSLEAIIPKYIAAMTMKTKVTFDYDEYIRRRRHEQLMRERYSALNNQVQVMNGMIAEKDKAISQRRTR